MQAFAHIPLGTPIPDSPHAVSCSLPTMRAIRGYEEKDPDIVRHLAQPDYLRIITEIHIEVAVLPRFEEISIPTRTELIILLL